MTGGYLVVSHHVQHDRIGDDVLCFDGQKIHLLSGSSAEIWALVDGSRTRDQVVEELRRRHPDIADLAQQTTEFLESLTDRGLVVTTEVAGHEWRAASHVAWVADGAVVTVLDLRTGRRQALSATASTMWQELVAGGTQREVTSALRDTYPDAPDDLENVVSRWVTEMCERELLEAARPATA